MAGILDFLTGNDAAASPWGVLYQAPPVVGGQAEQERRAQEAAALGAMGIDPASLFQKSPFDPAAKPIPSAPMPAPAPSPFAPAPAPNLGTGAPTVAPFGFAGPGSMNVDPSQVAAPAPAAPAPASFGAGAQPVPFAGSPVTPQPPAGTATDLSSVNRNPAPVAPAADDEETPAAPTRPPVAPVVTGGPSSPAPFSLGGSGFGDRLGKATRGFLGNLGNGPIGALAGGLGALVTGQNTDPSSIAAEGGDLTARALMNKGASADEVMAARKNPALMSELVKQYFGPKTVQALADGYVWDPRAGKAVKAYDPRSKTEDGIAERDAALRARGLDPKDPRNQQFALTGKFPREDAQPLTATDKKAIQDADEKVLNIRGVVDNLNNAKKLSKQSYDGWLAAQRGGLAANVGLEGGVNTADLENLVTGNALGQLKAIFGGNPTEGERKILLEVQGSVNQPDAVRQRIWDRAITIAQNKLAMEEQRSNELRGGTFYKQGGGMSGARAPAAAPGVPAGWSVQQR